MNANFSDVVEANLRYAEGFDLRGLAGNAARGLAVVTCIDSRIEPLSMLGLGPGDAKILRNAGARITEGALRSLVLATNLLDARRVMIVAHTDCAMSNRTDEQLHDAITASTGVDARPLTLHAATNQVATLERDITRLYDCGLLAPGTVIGGFLYDVDTGRIRQVVEPVTVPAT